MSTANRPPAHELDGVLHAGFELPDIMGGRNVHRDTLRAVLARLDDCQILRLIRELGMIERAMGEAVRELAQEVGVDV